MIQLVSLGTILIPPCGWCAGYCRHPPGAGCSALFAIFTVAVRDGPPVAISCAVAIVVHRRGMFLEDSHTDTKSTPHGSPGEKSLSPLYYHVHGYLTTSEVEGIKNFMCMYCTVSGIGRKGGPPPLLPHFPCTSIIPHHPHPSFLLLPNPPLNNNAVKHIMTIDLSTKYLSEPMY
jgi:hypothetical protein